MPNVDPEELGGEARLCKGACTVYYFQGDVFLVDVTGRLTSEILRACVDAIYLDPATLRSHAWIFRQQVGASFDSSVLSFHTQDVPRPRPAMVAVVPHGTVARMAASAAGLGFRVAVRSRFEVFDDLYSALVQARYEVAAARTDPER